MKTARAIGFGILGACAVSATSAVLRAAGIPIRLELLLGTVLGAVPEDHAFAVGLPVHLVAGGAFGLLYGWLFERVWDHGGASTGMILGVIHGACVGMFVGLTPMLRPAMPYAIPDPGPFFANAGVSGVVGFFGLHVLYGAIVGAGYGHVAAEKEWAPSA